MTKEEILNEIKEKGTFIGNDVLNDYFNLILKENSYNDGVKNLIRVVYDVSDFWEKYYYYRYMIKEKNIKLIEYIDDGKDEDLRAIIRVYNSLGKVGNGYVYLGKIKDTNKFKDCYDENLIISSLNTQSIRTVYEDFGEKFTYIYIKQCDYYNLLCVKNLLSEETINKIYLKCMRSKEEYKKVISLISKDEIYSLTKIYLKNGNNTDIAVDIIKNKYYKDEEFDKLIENIESYGTAKNIYYVLMNYKLSTENERKLEKALLRTGDIEYISYYYFFKNKDLFLKMFASTLLFLSFVQMNKELFKDAVILKIVTEMIKKENKEYQEEVKTNVYVMQAKSGRK